MLRAYHALILSHCGQYDNEEISDVIRRGGSGIVGWAWLWRAGRAYVSIMAIWVVKSHCGFRHNHSIGGSSNGRTLHSGCKNWGSNPCPPASDLASSPQGWLTNYLLKAKGFEWRRHDGAEPGSTGASADTNR